jgi:gluconolactonase
MDDLIFSARRAGTATAIDEQRSQPNGITLSPNGRTLYVSDSDQRLVRAYDLDGKGIASNERVVVEKIAGVPDGIRTDEKGNLYVAAKSVYVYSLPNARLLGEVPVGETPSNIAFGDADLETLFITARTSVYRVRLGVKGALQY